MIEHAWVVFAPHGDAVGIDSHDPAAAWDEFLGIDRAAIEGEREKYEAAGFRCLRVKLFEVGPA